jgi:hypothetical protein
MRAAPSILLVSILLGCSDTTGPSGGGGGGRIVDPPKRTSFRVAPASATLQAGQAIQLTASTAGDAALTTGHVPVAWQSSEAAVATVSPTGLVRGISGGQATIVATWGTYQASALVTVNGPMKKHEDQPVCLIRHPDDGRQPTPQC